MVTTLVSDNNKFTVQNAHYMNESFFSMFLLSVSIAVSLPTSVSSSPSVTGFITVELVHAIPRHSPQADEQRKPFWRHEHRNSLQKLLQLHLITSSRHEGASGRSVHVGCS